MHGNFYDIAVKSRPVLAALCTFTLGGVLYIASHTIAEERATAAALQLPELQVKPSHEKPATPPAQMMHQMRSKAEASAKPEGQSKEKEENAERRSDQSRRQELCKKLEQRRAELRAERKATQAKEAQE